MIKSMHKGWYYQAVSITVMILLLAAFYCSGVDTKTAKAVGCGDGGPLGRCFLGRAVNKQNYGTVAQVGTTNPNTPNGGSSFMLVQTRASSTFIQTGWTKQNPTLGHVWVFWESYSDAIGYTNGFYDPSFGGNGVTGDNNYYNDYNGSYWCHGFGGTACFMRQETNTVRMGSVPSGWPTPGTVAYYGETSDTTTQMGGPNQANAIYILNPHYKINISGSLSDAAVTDLGNSYAGSDPNGGCGFNPCPYNYGFQLVASVLDVFIWTR